MDLLLFAIGCLALAAVLKPPTARRPRWVPPLPAAEHRRISALYAGFATQPGSSAKQRECWRHLADDHAHAALRRLIEEAQAA